MRVAVLRAVMVAAAVLGSTIPAASALARLPNGSDFGVTVLDTTGALGEAVSVSYKITNNSKSWAYYSEVKIEVRSPSGTVLTDFDTAYPAGRCPVLKPKLLAQCSSTTQFPPEATVSLQFRITNTSAPATGVKGYVKVIVNGDPVTDNNLAMFTFRTVAGESTPTAGVSAPASTRSPTRSAGSPRPNSSSARPTASPTAMTEEFAAVTTDMATPMAEPADTTQARPASSAGGYVPWIGGSLFLVTLGTLGALLAWRRRRGSEPPAFHP
ncbi:hypothetical protein GCM10010399_72670 [Dactylosporangium fulvum]|uniref:LPXTG-motif cell wall anchor domain-containing protein n=1 Tax=Dactylosporangium fulvum TaxID=53359 RepID=A0ABY5VTD3_9ACTN|nr:hypothetical protein [Dactylosporangium fulvum]UWP80815.1 hypothetical protein Dfulv_37615 [Dactylosporangium fulvum]